jgi:3-dehydroquinate synthetase/nucleoside-diphosphate-sugar epimerase
MRVMVTGAQGFIGRATVLELLAAGHSVVGLGRSTRRDDRLTHEVSWASTRLAAPTPAGQGAALESSRYSYWSVDMLDTPALTRLLDATKPQAVVHLAAALRDETPERLVAANIGAVASLVNAVAGSHIGRPTVVFGSSGSVYGAVEGRALPLREDHPCAPLDPYSVSKRAAEDMSRVLCAQQGIPATWARIFNPVGPAQDERHLCGWLGRQVAEMATGARPPELLVGPLHTSRDYIHVTDTAAALRLVLERGVAGEVYNVASGEETTGTTVLETLSDLAGLAGSIVLTPRPARPSDMERHYADISKLAALGFEARRSLADSLGEVLAYYVDEVRPAAEGHRGPEPAAAAARVSVHAEQRHGYVVETASGLRHELPTIVVERFPDRRVCILTDSTLADLHLGEVVAGLRRARVDVGTVVVPAGEASKSQATADVVIAALRDLGFDRRSLLVNLGGGMVTDLGGYVAATYLRGVPYMNVATTLLAQHDSSVGGKVAVNTAWAKNFVGAFHHPVAVLNDPELLLTLPARDVAAGVAESIKVAVCGAPGLFEWLEAVEPSELRRDAGLLGDLVCRSVEAKVALLAPDPYEVDLRRVLNLGHTFGHPLETQLDYRGILHGEAVAFGLAVATAVGVGVRMLDPAGAERILSLLRAHDLPPVVAATDLRAAVKRFDDVRLVRAGALNFVVPTSVSSVEVLTDLPDGAVEAAIEWLAGHPLTSECVQR